MMRVALLTIVLLFASCLSSTPPHAITEQEAFANRYLLFDMDSEVSRYPCTITGTIPEWLSGTLLRNGPAKFQVEKMRLHWFDGLAMLHAFECHSGRVCYTNRFLQSEPYFIVMDEKSTAFAGFAQDPCPLVFGSQLSAHVPDEMRGIRNANVSIQDYADTMVALTEVPLPVVFDPASLVTLGNFSYTDALEQGQWESAHPLKDPVTKETFNYFVRFGRESAYVVWKMAENEATRSVIAEIPVDRPAYMHSFALTEHYVVLVEFPFVVRPLDLMLLRKPFIFNYRWEPERGTQFLVIDRATGKVVRIKGNPFFAFHHVNAFDRDGHLFIDIVTYQNANVICTVTDQPEDAQSVAESEITRLERFTIDLAHETLKQETLINEPMELPRVPSRSVAHEYRYAYAVDMRFPTTVAAKPALYQIDVTTKSAKRWAESGCFPGEPIFVPRPGGGSEDDGVVLSVVLDFVHQRSFLLVLDAKDFTEIARAYVPHPIPVGLHGLWRGAS